MREILVSLNSNFLQTCSSAVEIIGHKTGFQSAVFQLLLDQMTIRQEEPRSINIASGFHPQVAGH